MGVAGKGQGAGTAAGDWNILYHLGGNGPWIEKTEGVVEGGVGPPKGCVVEQVHMMSRHAERFPTTKAGNRMLRLVKKLTELNITYVDDLAFLNDWVFFSKDPESEFEQLTTTGPYSGSLGAFTTGVRLRTRYHHLLPQRLSHDSKTTLWASGCPRVIDTAQYFSAGFFGLNWNTTSSIRVIPETDDLGADTLTPGDTCKAFNDDKELGHDQGAKMMAKYRSTYVGPIRERLLKQNPAIKYLADDEIYAMQEMCGFEITARGSSPWCDVFTRDEFISFEYARDIVHYYRGGPGTPWGPVMGWLWLNATMNLLLEGSSAGPFFFNFVHDGDIAPMLAALDLLPDPAHLPTTHITHDRSWKKSQVSPMGGRTIFERLACRTASAPTTPEIFVRINVNDGIVPLPGCSHGVGSSCPLADFQARIAARGVELGDFREKCGLGMDAPGRITFLRQGLGEEKVNESTA
ncbi:phosphoglycerate mutase-like protein [Mytilinidion resinicola]|uniref:Phosphoglycerate mutase-like protein n=1 Tax=Mytilinidion resinicola TaxID=574789 RepID=A0A6A6YNZ2_9PEZI|nr:phosphoglycerate mutase-like protein [Mytilinidion resinicola]KAF2810248.1 phosphoglycerate mutase-like protein [Mytilinidion resinicola]